MRQTLAERFWSKATNGPGCWEWQSSTNPGGYGNFKYKGRTVSAHRVAWELAHGPLPSGEGFHGVCVCHRCDNRRCVNPMHLFLGTQHDNVQDARAKGRTISPQSDKTHCPQGHEYSPENTGYGLTGGRQTRFCRECKRARCRAQYAKNRASHIARAIHNAEKRREREPEAFAASKREHARAYRERRRNG